MEQETSAFQIRPARLDEAYRLREIEDQASVRFLGLGLIVDESLDTLFPQDDVKRLIGMGQAWVGCLGNGPAVGMVMASERDGVGYIEEIDVLPEHGRRGLGGRLLARAGAWAQAQGYVAVTLSTFRDVPWNGPFYRKHGFRDLRPEEWTPGMRTIRNRETEWGLKVDVRVFMRRELIQGHRVPGHGRPDR
jgi:4-diphosphocytidyl-2-C-methyl-D-erythritol kinase